MTACYKSDKIMTYKTIYKVVEGDKNTFEKELNKLSEQGYIWGGNMNTNITEKGVFYSQLMTKTEQIE